MKSKQQKREEAKARQEEYNNSSLAIKFQNIEARRGESMKEFARLVPGKGKK